MSVTFCWIPIFVVVHVLLGSDCCLLQILIIHTRTKRDTHARASNGFSHILKVKIGETRNEIHKYRMNIDLFFTLLETCVLNVIGSVINIRVLHFVGLVLLFVI